MARIAAPFQPTVDTFGELTLHAQRMGSQFLTTTWTGVQSRFDDKALINTLIMLAFLLSFALFVIGVVVVDQIVFTDASQAVQAYYGGVPLDYN